MFLLNFLQCSEIHSFSRTCLRLSVCLCISLSMCVKVWACTYMSSCMCARMGDLPVQLRLSLFVDFVDFVSKIQLPNTFRCCVVLCQDAHSAQSQQQLEACMYGWIHMHVCIYGYVFTRTRVSLCPSLHKRHAPSTNWSQWNFFVARSTPSFKMKSKWDI